jgi:hypothetical protein
MENWIDYGFRDWLDEIVARKRLESDDISIEIDYRDFSDEDMKKILYLLECKYNLCPESESTNSTYFYQNQSEKDLTYLNIVWILDEDKTITGFKLNE